jgi:3-hydroxybutyryl-CoA dehydratase
MMGRRPAPGDEVRATVHADADLVRAFAATVGDFNPVHLDAAYAAGTRFGRPIVHGTLFLGMLGKMMGMDLPGPGTIYLEHQVRFLAPVYVGDRPTVRVAVLEALPRGRFRLATQVISAAGDLCVDGVATVWNPTVVP